MTENTEDPIDLLYEAAHLCGFDRRTGWPERFESHHFVLLMAGGGLRQKPDAWRLARAQVEDGIRAGTLKIIEEPQPPKRMKKLVGYRPYYRVIGPRLFDWDLNEPAYKVPIYEEVRIELKPKQYISREACRDWLRAIGKTPPRLVRAWLGPIWQEDVVKRTRGALVKELQSKWPTIERDLQDASRNGLAAAKLTKGRGWDKDRALEWAKEHGKLIEKEVAT